LLASLRDTSPHPKPEVKEALTSGYMLASLWLDFWWRAILERWQIILEG
jgi:hypothetical protein